MLVGASVNFNVWTYIEKVDLKYPYRQDFIYLSDSMYHPMNFGKKKFDLDKMQYFLEVLKMFKFAAILVPHSHQSSLVWNEL